MNTTQIECVLRHDRRLTRYVKGVFSSDTLPIRVRDYPSAYICNTDPSRSPGMHWIVFWFEGNVVEFFDSFGHPPSYYTPRFDRFWSDNVPTCRYNSQQLQRDDSDTCGHHVLYYLNQKVKKTPLVDIVQTLYRKDDPDDYVRRYVIRSSRCL